MPIVIEQLNSQTHWGEIDGVTTLWNFTFSGGYIMPEHVKAYYIAADDTRHDIPVNPELMLLGPFQLEILPEVPADAKRLVIYRDTPKDLPLVDFEDGARVTERNLDRIAQQAVFIAAEILDAIVAAGMGTSGVSLSDLLTRVSALEAALGSGGGSWSTLAGLPADSTALTDRINALIAATPPSSPAWGSITGTLADQTDLQSALGAKQGAVQFKDEGTNVGTSGGITSIDFVGAGVSASESGGALTVTVSGGGGGGSASAIVSRATLGLPLFL